MKKYLLILLIALAPLFSQAQLSLEIGGLIGGSNYEGDLAYVGFVPQETQLGGGGMVRLNFNKFLTARIHYMAMKISGKDSNSPDSRQDRVRRNLSFETPVREFAFIPEWYILGIDPYEDKRFSPYVFAGIAMFNFNPTTNFQNQTIELQPLGTEGQGMPNFPAPYELREISIPFGGGIKFALSDNWFIGAEFGWRKTFTDYLDDVSTNYVPDYNQLLEANGELAAELSSRTWEYQNILCDCNDNLPESSYEDNTRGIRGDPEDLDWYMLGGITITYRFSDLSIFGGGPSDCYSF